jgi:hypothetical protein
MRFRLAVFSFVTALAILHVDAQSPPAQTSRPAILGEFAQGKYSNTVLGVMLEFPINWQVDDLESSEQFARSTPRQMFLGFKSSEDRVLLFADPVTPDEKLNRVFAASFMGARDGWGFKVVGKQMSSNIDGCEVLFQTVSLKSKAGKRFGVYRGFFSHGYYVSVLHLGPQNTDKAREAIVTNLHIQP